MDQLWIRKLMCYALSAQSRLAYRLEFADEAEGVPYLRAG